MEVEAIDSSKLDTLIASPNCRIHFVGVAGTGMSALADYRALSGLRCSGSDRFFDRGQMPGERQRLEKLGIAIFPQDGSGVEEADLVVASTAVEAQISDLVRAKERHCPCVHRSVFLAALLRTKTSIAVAGTSGKSSVAAMIFELLKAGGFDPAIITGGDLLALRTAESRGNAHFGQGPLIIEADESDKSLVHYEADYGVVLNLHKDHDEPEAILPVFATFLSQVKIKRLVGSEPAIATLRPGALCFGLGDDKALDLRAQIIDLGPNSSRFSIDGQEFELPIPGEHNINNAVAAIVTCREIGLTLAAAARGLAQYQGVSRRFEVIGHGQGIEVIDDYAHNPAKLAATLKTAVARAQRVLAIFQPHGYGPTKFMRKEYIQAVRDTLRPQDHCYLVEIFFPGGTVTRDISSQELVDELKAGGQQAFYAKDHAALVSQIREAAKSGDLILLMGARDPSLADLAQSLWRAVSASSR